MRTLYFRPDIAPQDVGRVLRDRSPVTPSGTHRVCGWVRRPGRFHNERSRVVQSTRRPTARGAGASVVAANAGGFAGKACRGGGSLESGLIGVARRTRPEKRCKRSHDGTDISLPNGNDLRSLAPARPPARSDPTAGRGPSRRHGRAPSRLPQSECFRFGLSQVFRSDTGTVLSSDNLKAGRSGNRPHGQRRRSKACPHTRVPSKKSSIGVLSPRPVQCDGPGKCRGHLHAFETSESCPNASTVDGDRIDSCFEAWACGANAAPPRVSPGAANVYWRRLDGRVPD